MNKPIINPTPIVTGITALIISFMMVVFNAGNAYAFFWNDNTDYTPVEKAFSQQEPIQFFSYTPNNFCDGGWIDEESDDTFSKKMHSSKSHGRVAYHSFAPTILSSVAGHMRYEMEPVKWASNEEQFSNWVEWMVRMANKRIMTDNQWSGGGSPAYGQTVILYNLAVFVNYMDVKNLWRMDQRESIVKWGDELYENSHYSHHSNGSRQQSHRWPDTVARASASYALWAVATKNIKQFKDSYRDFKSLQKKIKANGAINQFFEGPYSGKLKKNTWDLYLETKTAGDMVVAAYVNELVGMPSFEVENKKGGSVKKFIKWIDEAHFGPNNKLDHKGWQDDRHIDNRRTDGTSWMSVYRLMDKSDSLVLADHHLERSTYGGYSWAKTLTYSRCLTNELN